MKTIYLLTGCNLGKRVYQIDKASRLCESSIGKVVRKSDIFETEAWGKTDQPLFLNQALEIQTSLFPLEVLHQIIIIEKKLGRLRTEKWGERRMDIDILLFSNEVINTTDLQIPHPYLHLRRFALAPLVQLAPGYIHPAFQLTISQLLEQCPDTLEVWHYKKAK
ncbi:MAG: 2-amino-4-hydroxy-6-hydroxymethyldihydropteridine diphosphokinase [Sphingobacteriales bacterium]|nr:MAG: 2-amino-4-hydroxy-6-hydroxymethyldihydropteridine diphosphokinase [Sphingobacteriales bacterium]